MEIREHNFQTARTARYFMLGGTQNSPKELWIVLHGYGYAPEIFLRNFKVLAGESRLIIAPEGLSRFYLDGYNGRTGASWMTKTSRDTEIADYVRYLDGLYAHILESLADKPEKIVLLGFSQGASAAARWFSKGRVQAAALIVWAGEMPPDISPEGMQEKLSGGSRLWYVHGDADEFISAERFEQSLQYMQENHIPYHEIIFQGRHILHEETLLSLAKEIRAGNKPARF